MGRKIACILEITGCLILAACTALCITGQALPWWVFDSTDANKDYKFGRYRVCTDIRDTKDRDTTTCYQFSPVGMQSLATDLGLASVPNAETQEGRNIWILAFIGIIFTGLSFFISVGIVKLGFKGKIMHTVFYVQTCLLLIAGAVGTSSVIRAYDFRKEVWRPGGVLLHAKGLAQWIPASTGVGFICQVTCYALVWVALVVYVILIFAMRQLEKYEKAILKAAQNKS